MFTLSIHCYLHFGRALAGPERGDQAGAGGFGGRSEEGAGGGSVACDRAGRGGVNSNFTRTQKGDLARGGFAWI